MNPDGCEWEAVNELPGVYTSAVAWVNRKNGKSVKWSRMTLKNAKKSPSPVTSQRR